LRKNIINKSIIIYTTENRYKMNSVTVGSLTTYTGAAAAATIADNADTGINAGPHTPRELMYTVSTQKCPDGPKAKGIMVEFDYSIIKPVAFG
jgi:hypothetical protein